MESNKGNAREKHEETVVVHTAGTVSEAMVIRGLLESAGIPSPGSVSTDPFPLRDVPEGTHGVEIIVRASDEAAARALISSHVSGAGDDEKGRGRGSSS